MSTKANHIKRSHRSQRAHYRAREKQIVSASKYMSARKNDLFGFQNAIRKIISRPHKRTAAAAGEEASEA